MTPQEQKMHTALCAVINQMPGSFASPEASVDFFCQALEELRLYLAQRLSWQPIESAPLDGTEVLLYDKGTIDYGSWGFIEFSEWDGKPIYGWTSDYGNIEEPSHWMPLDRPNNDK